MAADKQPDQEPSIEEILASIRQIISDDEDKDAEPPAPPAPEPVFEPAPVVKAAPPPPPPAPEPEDDILELNNPIEPEPMEIDLQEYEEPAAPPPPPPRQAAPVDSILTENARNATLSSMAKLAGNMPITRHREYGNVTLEDLVREMLHPMLRDWLSDNLPPMVERMVQKELEKLARQAQDV